MVHDGNKDEAEKCFNLADKYFREGNRAKAFKFAQKAQKLYPLTKTQDLIEVINRLGSGDHSSHSNGNAGGDGDGGGGKSGSENVRRRKSSVNDEKSSSASGASTEYTSDQLEAVKRIRNCKDYYQILGVTKEATDNDLKKAYRKLALQFHPDKNKAPGASEAFKAVGNAFAVLSDTEKRKQYDLYGPEEASTSTHHRSSYGHHDYTRGYESDMTAEELFNMFFGGGYPSGNVYVHRSGRWERSGGHGARFSASHGHHHQPAHSEQSNLSVFLQLMPLLLILLLSLASSLLSSDPTYSLSPTSKYSVQRSTSGLGISYYVKPDFSTEYQGSIRRLEQQVEEDYVSTLRNACFKEKNYKENMIWRARSFGDAQMFKRAQELRTPSCDSLQSLYS